MLHAWLEMTCCLSFWNTLSKAISYPIELEQKLGQLTSHCFGERCIQVWDIILSHQYNCSAVDSFEHVILNTGYIIECQNYILIGRSSIPE